MPRFKDAASTDKRDQGHRGHPTYFVGDGTVTPQGTVVDIQAHVGGTKTFPAAPAAMGCTPMQRVTHGLGGLGQGTQLQGGGHSLPDSLDVEMTSAYSEKPRTYQTAQVKTTYGMRSRPGSAYDCGPDTDHAAIGKLVLADGMRGGKRKGE